MRKKHLVSVVIAFLRVFYILHVLHSLSAYTEAHTSESGCKLAL